MTEVITQLTYNAINSLIKQNDESESIVVQVIDFQSKKDKFYVTLSDGLHTIKALPKDQLILDSKNDVNSIIVIKRHMTGKNNVVGILQFQKVFNYKTRIGNPQQYTSETVNPQSIQSFKIDQSLIRMMEQVTIKKENLQNNTKKIQSKTADTLKKVPAISNQPIKGNINDYETIKMLYVGMDRWTIICRIVKKDYSEFISKKTGKQTKCLNIQLMDRAGMKMSGVFFGQAAQKFRDQLVKDRVYKISQGQIREQSYNNSKNQKISPFKLVFTNLSIFEEVSDTSSIAKNQDAAITLGDCVQRRVLGQQYDIICILIKIQDTIDVKKQGNILKKTNLLVADPVKNLTLHAVVWSQNLIPEKSLIGKAIILSRFKLSEYKNSLNLGSVYKSSIIPVQNHLYQQYESKVMEEYHLYEKLHQIKSSNNDYNDEVCLTIKQLESKIQQLGSDEWARGDYTIHINKFALKKWHYDGCPHCDKATQSHGNCNHCGKFVQKTIGHFIMGVQICDATGSLWTSAYDQWAKKIFNVTDQGVMIDHLMTLTAEQLKQETQAYLFQEFRLRISSKKDKEGRIKHNVSKVYDRNYVDETLKNIELINKLFIS